MPEPSLLPPVADAAAWSAMELPESTYRDAVGVVAARHGLRVADAAKAVRGSSPVFLTAAHAFKLIPPPWLFELPRELLALERVHGRLPVRTPAVIASGHLDGWGYLVTERLDGVGLRELLPSLDSAGRASIGRQVGEALAALHEVPCADLELLTVDWQAFAAERAEACIAFQRTHGLAPAAVAALPEMLARGAPWVPDARRALLHADLHHEHALVEAHGDGWRLTGIIDFGDAVVGHPEYDMLTPAFFVAGADPACLGALFAGAGFSCDSTASHRLMAWSAMHRFNALARFLPADHGADALEDLRSRYWPVTRSASTSAAP